MYERFGFRYVSRYPENANLVEYEPYLVYLEYIFDQDAGSSEANEAQSG
jgi:hypothetical protein